MNFKKVSLAGPARWHMLVIPALERWRKEDHKFEAILGYKARLYLKRQKTNKQKMSIILTL
jgi:hypothetical protein